MFDKEECVVVANIFATRINGKKFFDMLRDRLIMPVANPEISSSHAYFREGENELIRKLFRMNEEGIKIKRGDNE